MDIAAKIIKIGAGGGDYKRGFSWTALAAVRKPRFMDFPGST